MWSTNYKLVRNKISQIFIIIYLFMKVFSKLSSFRSLKNVDFLVTFPIYQEVFLKCFLHVFFKKTLFTHIVELFIANLSSKILYCERCFTCGHLITKYCDLCDHQVVIFFALCLTFCLPSCVEVWESWSCVLPVVSFNSSVDVHLWKILSG